MAAREASKKLINDPLNAVDEALEGIVAANPGLKLLNGHRVIIRDDIDSLKRARQVTLISGGGSGHEPSHSGFVGKGMLSAAVAGEVFTSPPTGCILAAIRAVGKDNEGGTLLIVKNYTGDRLNFGFAAERAKAEGVKVEMVVVGEDCALTSRDKTAGRRGLCGTVLIHKIAGALAEEGKSLEAIISVAKSAIQAMGTMGVGLTPCSVPGSLPSFTLNCDEIELGLGIHGEPGVKRVKIEKVNSIVKNMLDHMSDVQSGATFKLTLSKGDCVALVVNNLGGTSVLELNIAARAAINYLTKEKQVQVERVYVGSFMTSLEMAGISLTLLHLDDTRRHCLDQSTQAPAWPRISLSQSSGYLRTDKERIDCICEGAEGKRKAVVGTLTNLGEQLFSVIGSVTDALLAAEARLNELDNLVGDGDCGSTLARGARAVKEALGTQSSPGLPCNHPEQLLSCVASLCEDHMGGSSGVFYSLFLMSGSVHVRESSSAKAWALGWEAGVQAIMRYGGAEPGDRTMLDALYPAGLTMKAQVACGTEPLEALKLAVEAAEKGAQATSTMAARAGRSSYVSENRLNCPDPGALAVAIWFRAVFDALRKQ